MAATKETAEEQLLRMIEGPPGPQGGPSRGPMRASPGERLAAWLRTAATTLRRLAQLTQQHRDRADTFLWRLQLINRVFWVALLGLGIYLVIDLVVLRPKPPTLVVSRPSAVPEPLQGEGATVEIGAPIRTLDDYQQALKRRNPFRMANTEVVEQTKLGDATHSDLDTLLSTLRMVGINRGAVPEALIEDSEMHRTHVVKVGDDVNGLRVESIDESGVQVSYEGKTAYIP